MNATAQVHAALAAARNLPGWNVNRLGSGAYRVMSPTGMYLVPAKITPDTGREALAELDALGLQHDLHHRPIPAPAPATQPDLFTVNTETEPATVPPTTKTKPATKTATTTRKARPRLIRFDFPDTPQTVSLDQLLPQAFKGQGRCLVPRVTITADIAQALFDLRAEKQNRRLRPSNIRKFRRLIAGGHFEHTHQGVAFNEEGQCSDGQHRLAGLIAACEDDPDTTIVVDITYNAPKEAAQAYDGGANRTNVDRLNVAGFDNAHKIAPLVRLLYLYEEIQDVPRSWNEIPPLDQATLIEWSERYGGELFDSFEAVRSPLRGTFANLHVAAVCRFLALQEWEEAPFDKFVEALGEPTLQARSTPQRALVSWLRNNHLNSKRVTQQQHIAFFLVAYNDFCQGNERTVMKWLPGDGRLPVPYSPDAETDE